MNQRRPGLQSNPTENKSRRLPPLANLPTPQPAPKKVKHSVYLTTEISEELKDAAVALSATPDAPAGVSGISEEAIGHYLQLLREQFNAGKPFPTRHRDPRPGRRVT